MDSGSADVPLLQSTTSTASVPDTRGNGGWVGYFGLNRMYFYEMLEFGCFGLWMSMFVMSFLQLNAYINVKLAAWIGLSIASGILVICTISVIRARLKKLSLYVYFQGDSKTWTPAFREAASREMGKRAIKRLVVPLIFGIFAFLQFVFVYRYAVRNSSAALNALDNGFNTGQVQTFIQRRYEWALDLQFLTGALYLGKWIDDVYFSKWIDALKYQQSRPHAP
jgi:hypothetical protein